MLSRETSAGAGLPDNKPEDGGAGSMDVYTLLSSERDFAEVSGPRTHLQMGSVVLPPRNDPTRFSPTLSHRSLVLLSLDHTGTFSRQGQTLRKK